MAKNKKMEVTGVKISLYTDKSADFISLTDIARYRDAQRSDYILQNWMRNRSTIEFMGLWEKFNNPDFNSIEFDGIKNMAILLKPTAKMDHRIFLLGLIVVFLIIHQLFKRWWFNVNRKRRRVYYRNVYLKSDEWQRKPYVCLTVIIGVV